MKHIERQSSGNLKTHLIRNAATVREYIANELHNTLKARPRTDNKKLSSKNMLSPKCTSFYILLFQQCVSIILQATQNIYLTKVRSS